MGAGFLWPLLCVHYLPYTRVICLNKIIQDWIFTLITAGICVAIWGVVIFFGAQGIITIYEIWKDAESDRKYAESKRHPKL